VVLAGQYLERPALVAAGAIVLEGLHHRGERRPALLVCPAPGPGGGMDAPVVAELAWAAARAGHPSLRFQHRGVGGSQGEPEPARAVEDAEAALRHLSETAGPRIAVAGVGEGCETALALARAHPEIQRVALVVPARAPGPPWPSARVLVLLAQDGGSLRAADLASSLRDAGRVEVVEGADPLFRRGLPRAGRAVLAFVTSADGAR